MNTEFVDEKPKRAYLKEKGKLLSAIVGVDEAKRLTNDFFSMKHNSPLSDLVTSFENSYLQSICNTAKASMDREYYKQSTGNLNIISGFIIATLAISVISNIYWAVHFR